MIVVIENLFERSTVNHRLIAFETFALFAFERFDRDGTKLDSFHHAPRSDVSLENLDSVKACFFERDEKTLFGQRTGDAAAPKFRIVLQFLRHYFIAHNVRDHGAAAFL